MKKPRFKRHPNEFEIADYDFGKTLIKYHGHKRNVTVPPGVVTIDDFSFAKNTDVCKIILPESCKHIRCQAFRECKNLRSIKIPETIESVSIIRCKGDAPLYRSKKGAYESKRKRVLINGPWRKDATFRVPPSVRVIASDAFMLSNVQKVIIPKSVQRICDCAFSATSELTRVYFDKGIKHLGSNLFGCGDERFFKDDDGCWYESENRHVLLSIPIDIPNVFKVRESVLSIESEAFNYNNKLERIVLPKGLKSLSSFSFIDCHQLKEITIPNAVKSIGHRTFEKCYSLREVSLSKDLEEIGTLAFIDCHSLERIIIPENVQLIDNLAFSGCTSLKEIVFKGLFINAIECLAFQKCTNLERIILPEIVGHIYADVFEGCDNLKEIVLSRNLTQVNETSFTGCNARLIPWDEYHKA